MEQPVTIKLTKNEALVLLELVSRINKEDRADLFEDQAEQRILWDLESTLESNLVEPFQTDFSEAVLEAREAIRDSDKK